MILYQYEYQYIMYYISTYQASLMADNLFIVEDKTYPAMDSLVHGEPDGVSCRELHL